MLPYRFLERPEKAPRSGAFFAFLLWVMVYLLAGTANAAQLQRVSKVIDGDTVILENGDHIRFIGVNTPELGHGKFKDEPLANQARLYVKRKIEGRNIELRGEPPRRDKYGRRLAHIYSQQGESIQIGLLKQGLAFVVAVSEDLSYLTDYLAAEQQAKDANKGIWGEPFYAPLSAKKAVDYKKRGYRQISGVVKRVTRSKNYQTFHLEGDFRVLVSHVNWSRYFKGKPQDYVGKPVLVSGWVFKSHGVTGMKVYHSSMMETAELNEK